MIYDSTNIQHQLNMLIHVTRSVPHPLTIFALGHYFTDKGNFSEFSKNFQTEINNKYIYQIKKNKK